MQELEEVIEANDYHKAYGVIIMRILVAKIREINIKWLGKKFLQDKTYNGSVRVIGAKYIHYHFSKEKKKKNEKVLNVQSVKLQSSSATFSQYNARHFSKH